MPTRANRADWCSMSCAPTTASTTTRWTTSDTAADISQPRPDRGSGPRAHVWSCARYHQRCAGLGVVDDLAPETVDVLDELFGDHGLRITVRDDASPLHGDDLIGITAGMVEVVKHHDD